MKRQIKDLFYSVIPKEDYLEYSEGQINLLLSAPHGGGIRPYSIPHRKWGKVKKDTKSLELAEKIISLYSTCEKPYYVFSEIHRSRVDLNRYVKEAAQGNYRAEQIWYNWVNILGKYKQEILDENRYGLYIDIHSKGEDDLFELGYNISAKDYLSVYRGYNIYNKSTLDYLSPRYSLNELLFGRDSIKVYLEDCGYKVLLPKGDEGYFNGGRNIRAFSGKGMGSLQIEVPVEVLKKDLDGIAYCLYNAIENFRKKFVK